MHKGSFIFSRQLFHFPPWFHCDHTNLLLSLPNYMECSLWVPRSVNNFDGESGEFLYSFHHSMPRDYRDMNNDIQKNHVYLYIYHITWNPFTCCSRSAIWRNRNCKAQILCTCTRTSSLGRHKLLLFWYKLL